ncbi:hypothetical protein KVT40_001095 [Elsinoe batatas]|uniref:HhH-GPD domain-containing protein n=1 Tax=Elsinoe batatas TaxID=2601811 RepID=A0A8K0LAV6_9PEZI|nr:hypothetical protein KVT40_001095 [Elsinoe batatas]
MTHKVLEREYGATVKADLAKADLGVAWPHVLQGVVVTILCQATGWCNAKRALAPMADIYGDSFAYDAIVDGGVDKLCETTCCRGLQNRKSKMLMKVLEQVHERHSKWTHHHLLDKPDSEIMQEMLSYNGMGPRLAYCVLSIVLKRHRFACPPNVARELVQAHLEDQISDSIKFDLHYLLITHGLECAHCKRGPKLRGLCDVRKEISTFLNAK